MKHFYLSLLLLLFGSILKGQDYQKYIRISSKELSITELTEIVYSQLGVRVFIVPDSLSKTQLEFNADSLQIIEDLRSELYEKGLSAICWQGNILITKQPLQLSDSLIVSKKSVGDTEYSVNQKHLTETEQKYLQGRGTEIVESITIGSQNGNKRQSKATITGELRDESSGETLIGATVYIEELKMGAATDLNGFFTLQIAPGTYSVRFDCLGQKSAKYQLHILSDGHVSLNLEKSVMQINEVMVYGDKSINVTTRDAGFERIPIATLKELPMMMGERDIIKVSELLPGIVTVGEGASGINVRGGNNDQNGFYINKVPVFNTSHAFGFFPAFNPDVIKDFSIYKGHMPAEFGGKLSSVFNIVTKQGNRKRFNIRGGLNPVTSNITLEGPIVKDLGSVLLSMRSTYSNWSLKRMEDPTIRNSEANFSDIILSTNFELGDKDQLNLFTYYSTDAFKLSDINRYNYSNMGGSLDWRRIHSQAVRSEVALIASRYSFGTIDQNIDALAYEHNYNISHYEIKAGATIIPSDKHKLDAGISLIGYNLQKGKVLPFTDASVRLPIDLGQENGFETTLYLSDSYDPTTWLNVYLGLRYSAYAPMGNRDVYTYSPGSPIDDDFISDTTRFGNLQPIKWYHGPEIRSSVNIKTGVNSSVKLAFNQTRQNMFMLNNTITISPNTQWQLANEHLAPQLGKQFSVGYFQNLPRHSYEFSVELFAKQTQNVNEFKDGANFISTPLIETMVLQGEQKAYGAELMLRKQKGRFNGWIAYTYSRSIIQVNGQEPWQKINNGVVYPSNYDIPHAINSVFNLRLSRRLNVSTTATYQTGRPITYPLSIYYINNIPVINYSSRNEFRIPDYFRLDLSVAIEGNLKRNKLFHSSWVFGIYNLTGRNNPLSIYFKLENGKIKGYKYAVIGSPIFTATWVFKLGNYAAN